MPRANFTDITILLDRSGSMAGIRAATVESLNAFIAEQKQVPGDGCWTLVQFDAPLAAGMRHWSGALSEGPGDWYMKTWDCVPQESARALTLDDFVPRGGTALVAAACRLIDETGARLARAPEHLRPARALFVIVTDGQENSSHLVGPLTHADLNARITHQREKYSWQFVFLGANQDAIAEAAKYGIPAVAAMNYQATNAGTRAAYGALGAATRNWKLDGNETAKGFIIEPQVNVAVHVAPGGP